MAGKKERDFQKDLIKEIENTYGKDCIVTKLNAKHIQGIPDLLILYKNKWATLEVKKDAKAPKRPNQDKYVDKMNKMSFSRVICPENKEEVLDALQRSFRPRRNACLSRSE